MIVFGHRGAPGFPRRNENTELSFREALGRGATGLEMDVRRCGDGTLVVIHDHTVNRTKGRRGKVGDLSWTALQQLDAGQGERIPRLADILDTFAGRCLLNLELKESGLGADVNRLISERDLQARLLVSAFDTDDGGAHATATWEELGGLASSVSVALLCSRAKLLRIGPSALVSEATRLGATAIHPQIGSNWTMLLPLAREAGLRVHVWTVNRPTDIAAIRRLQLDGVFTDFPERWLG